MTEQAPLTRTLDARLAERAANAAADSAIGDAPYAGTVTGVTITADAAVTGATATKRTLTLVNRGQAGAGTTVVATLDLITGVDLVKSDEKAWTLSAVEGATTVAEGDTLAVVEAVTGAGTANPGALVEVTIARA